MSPNQVWTEVQAGTIRRHHDPQVEGMHNAPSDGSRTEALHGEKEALACAGTYIMWNNVEYVDYRSRSGGATNVVGNVYSKLGM